MTERLIISVDPGPLELGQRVQEVFGHVLDLFELLAHSGSTEEAGVGWRLVRVSMNSPLTIEAEAIAIQPLPPGVELATVARRQRTTFARNVSALKHGIFPESWRSSREMARVRRAFGQSGRAVTSVMVPADDNRSKSAVLKDESVVVGPSDLPAVEKAIQDAVNDALPRPKTQRGSIEGQLQDITTYYGKPAIKVIERRSRTEVWCTVSEAHRVEIAEHANFDDVWSGRRVRVEGTLVYDEGGGLAKVIADSVHIVAVRDVAVDEIHDPNLTQGLSSDEYLDRFREGTLG
ncbi:MAG: hypothetical protein KIT35_09410 [Piscinibacter sp.]|uniref:hypothetical protein n=1 Tax=Piscinibacter sp. TaxID=1903157 RepID=UPI002587374F|nr:hypothetical protein [Piscinibacter sp.]MCW5664039.1 hypothetical protein [Piscinibacter sp.]